MSEKIFFSRQEKLKSILAKMDLDGMLISNITSVRYISGFTGSSAVCLILPEKQYFISDGRYDIQSKKEVFGFERIIESLSHLELMSVKKQNLIPKGMTIGFEGDNVSVSRYNEIKSVFPEVAWESTSMVLEKLQAVKDDSEIEAIREAVHITDSIYAEAVHRIKAGVTEKQIANFLVSRYRESADGEAYSPIVAGGPNSALPHAVPSDRPFESGDFIVIDAAAKVSGYHADMTRTPVLEEATDKHYEIYEIVNGAQQAGLDAAKPGVSCKDMDSATRDWISERGYGKYYNHSTGHGIGLEIHTQPRLSQLSQQVLEEGNLVTVEPGIYLPGWGGVRIEDDILITKTGCEILNKTTKELLIL